jgi:hypothetical protein
MVAGGSDSIRVADLQLTVAGWLSEFGLQLTVRADGCYSRWIAVDFCGWFQLAEVSTYSLKVSDSSYYFFVDTRM